MLNSDIILEVEMFVTGTAEKNDCIKNIPLEDWKFPLAVSSCWTAVI
jgi:hypothetical protein